MRIYRRPRRQDVSASAKALTRKNLVWGLRLSYQAFLSVFSRSDVLRVVALGIALAACSQAQAQTSYYTSLHDALVDFQNAWGVDLAYDASLVENRWTTWSKPEQRNADDDLAVLLSGTGIVAYRLASGTYSLRPARTRRGVISGTITDASTHKPLHNASVSVEGTPFGAATDRQGWFTISNVQAGPVSLSIRHVGYEEKRHTLLLIPGDHEIIEAGLAPIHIEHAPIEVWGMDVDFAPQLMKLNTIEGSALDATRGIGTADVVRSIGSVSGVALDEKSAGFHIQGGSLGEHQFYLEGSRLYNPVHSFGLVGALSPPALNRVMVYKAGFGASQGSNLSGVIRAEHALADTANTFLDVHIDPISFNGLSNMRISLGASTRLTLMAAYRTSVWNGWWSGIRSTSVDRHLLNLNEPDVFLFRASLYPIKKPRPDLYKAYTDRLADIPPPALPDIAFNDIHMAGQLLQGNHWLRASYYRGGNKLHGRRLIAVFLEDDESIPRPDAYDWVNEAAQVSWTVSALPSLLLSTRLRGSNYRLSHKYAGLDRDDARVLPFGERLFIELTPAEDGNKVREIGLEQTMELFHGGGSLATSLEYTLRDHRFIVRDIFPLGILHERTSASLALYVEEVMNAIPGIEVTAGTRLTYLRTRNEVYVEPRLSMTLRLRTGDRGVFVSRLAGGLYYQYLNQFDVSTISPSTLIPSTRVWLSVDETLPPPKSYHLAADAGMKFLDFWSLRVEWYYKRQPRVFRIDYPRLWQPDDDDTVDSETTDLTSQADFVALAEGFAYGTALVMERTSKRLSLHARYEHNIAEREYGFRGGDIRMVPVPWSEPQRLHLSAEATVFGRWRATARWRGVWGRVWGFRQPYYDYLATDTDQGLMFGGVDFRQPVSDQHRLTPLKQLDLGLTYNTTVGGSRLQIRADVLNALNRENQADLFLREVTHVPGTGPSDDFEEAPDLLIESQNLIERVLSFSLRLRW